MKDQRHSKTSFSVILRAISAILFVSMMISSMTVLTAAAPYIGSFFNNIFEKLSLDNLFDGQQSADLIDSEASEPYLWEDQASVLAQKEAAILEIMEKHGVYSMCTGAEKALVYDYLNAGESKIEDKRN